MANTTAPAPVPTTTEPPTSALGDLDDLDVLRTAAVVELLWQRHLAQECPES